MYSEKKHGDSPGFTLIELLIVVAIIAILAAIAVPNLLEAQVRGKVAHAKADMRTIGVAIENYRVDNNEYPQGHWSEFGGMMGTRPDLWNQLPGLYRNLTTPIAYLNAVPVDPFAAAIGGYDPDEPIEEPGAGFLRYRSARLRFNSIPLMPMPYRFYTVDTIFQDCWRDGAGLHHRSHKMGWDTKGVTWCVWSVGPAQTTYEEEGRDPFWSSEMVFWAPLSNAVGRSFYAWTEGVGCYDPTNGTKSLGFIILSNKGFAGS